MERRLGELGKGNCTIANLKAQIGKLRSELAKLGKGSAQEEEDEDPEVTNPDECAHIEDHLDTSHGAEEEDEGLQGDVKKNYQKQQQGRTISA